MKEKKNKRVGATALLIIIFLTGLSLLLYPAVSNFWNQLHQTRVISSYNQSVVDIDSAHYAEIWEQAYAYNRTLAQNGMQYPMSEELKEQYEALLNISSTGIMGYVEIPKINCNLPIYHGTDESVLQVAVGHLEWTSLPVGGEGTHSAISGHRGLPSAELLTHIDRLEVGDHFYIHILNEVLEYRVCDTFVVLPEDASKLQAEEGKDYMTLVTCTPYGINSHRLLVRGERVLDGQGSAGGTIYVNNEIQEVSLMYIIPVALAIIVLAVVLLTWIQEQRVVYRRKIRRYKRNQRAKRNGENIWSNDELENN